MRASSTSPGLSSDDDQQSGDLDSDQQQQTQAQQQQTQWGVVSPAIVASRQRVNSLSHAHIPRQSSPLASKRRASSQIDADEQMTIVGEPSSSPPTSSSPGTSPRGLVASAAALGADSRSPRRAVVSPRKSPLASPRPTDRAPTSPRFTPHKQRATTIILSSSSQLAVIAKNFPKDDGAIEYARNVPPPLPPDNIKVESDGESKAGNVAVADAAPVEAKADEPKPVVADAPTDAPAAPEDDEPLAPPAEPAPPVQTAAPAQPAPTQVLTRAPSDKVIVPPLAMPQNINANNLASPGRVAGRAPSSNPTSPVPSRPGGPRPPARVWPPPGGPAGRTPSPPPGRTSPPVAVKAPTPPTLTKAVTAPVVGGDDMD